MPQDPLAPNADYVLCRCCGECLPAEGRTICKRCIECECRISVGCSRPLSDWSEDAQIDSSGGE